MRTSMRLSFSLLLLLGLAACMPALQTPAATPAVPAPTLAPATLAPSRDADPASSFDASQALEHNKALAVTIGSRVAGSDNSARAGDYIAQHLQANGFSVERQPFPFDAWEDRETRVQVTAPEERELDAQAIQYSAPGDIDAELVAVRGTGSESDFSSVNVRGKVALVGRGTIPFSDKAKNAAQAGAVGILIYNNELNLFGGTLRERVAIPAIAISGQDGRALLDLVSRGAVRVKIAVDTAIANKTGHNIIGTKRGSGDGVIVLGGHYDSVSAGPGANDNASGTAVLLELARALGQGENKNTIVIIGFDAEELGLIGSRYYVEQLSQSERARIKGMLNFDMLGGGSGPLLLGGDGRLGSAGRQVAEQMGIQARNFSLGSGAGSDHEPFQRVGIDTIFFSRNYGLLHTPQDVIDEVRLEYLGEAGRVALQLVRELDQEQRQ